ncbi:preprotein translocase subunit SecG [Helicobacter cetorum]|uniref:preprotein translocase subunit SecG n=1 Tax=Helicobacter cetorum TaxID=138563 RepID=UPI000CF12FF7|nr:preprotein translocase subunit SecG [Helicobacter cetorum]
MTSALFWLQIILAVLIVIVVLLQKSSSIGLGAYSGSNDSLFGAKGPASFMAKLTMFLGLIFVINTIALGYLYNKDYNKSILDDTKNKKELSPLIPSSGAQKLLETPSSNLLNPLAPLEKPKTIEPKAPEKESLKPATSNQENPNKPKPNAQNKPTTNAKTNANTHNKAQHNKTHTTKNAEKTPKKPTKEQPHKKQAKEEK